MDPVAKVNLRKFEVLFSRRVRELKLLNETEVTSEVILATREYEVTVTGFIWALDSELKRIDVKWPDGWVQALKERVYHWWWLRGVARRWPVRWAHHIIDVEQLHPKANLPPELGPGKLMLNPVGFGPPWKA